MMRGRGSSQAGSEVREFTRHSVRIGVVVVALAAFLGLCIFRLGQLQLVQGSELAEQVARQVESHLGFFAKRGRIVDSLGKVLAMTVEVKGIEVHQPSLKHPEFVIDTIAGLLSMDVDRARRLVQCPSKYCYVERFLDPKTAEGMAAILGYRGDDPEMLWQQEMLSGVRIVNGAGRVYPFRELAGQVVGVARVPTAAGSIPSPWRLEGQYGVERALDDFLTGRKVVQKGQRRRGQGPALRSDNPDLVLESNTVELTLDANIQAIAEEELAAAVITSLARRGMAMVMEASTGHLLAVAHYPPFNPNGTREYSNDELWKWNDRAFTELFEPGSVMKPMIVGGALEEGVVGMDDTVFCENGSWKVERGSKPISDHGRHGVLSVREVITYSSNIGAAKVGFRLGREKVNHYLRRFGFVQRTGVVPEKREAKGKLNRGGQGWSDLELANISFGHGISVTLVQMVAAYGALANRGRLMRPILVKEVRDERGNVLLRNEPEVVAQVLSERSVKPLLEALSTVVEAGGTAEAARIFGYQVGGKTGTAQKVMSVAGPEGSTGSKRKWKTVYVDRWMASFVGIVPLNKPEFVIMVVIDEPEMNDFGGVVAAPAFSRIGGRALAYRNVLPDEERRHGEHERVPLPRAVAADPDEVEQGPTDAVAAVPTVGALAVPDFSGMSVREALLAASAAGLVFAAEGSGLAVDQEPRAGAAAGEAGLVKVYFGISRKVAGGEADGR